MEIGGVLKDVYQRCQHFSTNLLKSVEIGGISKYVYQKCQHSSMNLLQSVWKLEVFPKMCIEGAKTLPWICFKMFGNWMCFKKMYQRWWDSSMNLFQSAKIGGTSKHVYQKCQHPSTNLLKRVWKLEVFPKMCIKGAKTLPWICFKMFGNWNSLISIVEIPRFQYLAFSVNKIWNDY